MPGEAGRGFAVVAQEVKGLATQTDKATEEITRHIVSIEQTTPRSVQAIKKIAATIEQLSDVANDVAVAMRQQDAVTQERRGKGHARCLRECQRGLEQRCENRKGRLDGSDRGRRTGGAISSAAAGSRALSGAGPRRFVAAAYGGRGPISSVPTNPVMLADYTAATKSDATFRAGLALRRETGFARLAAADRRRNQERGRNHVRRAGRGSRALGGCEGRLDAREEDNQRDEATKHNTSKQDRPLRRLERAHPAIVHNIGQH